jgi:hypothetical protein
VAGDASPSQPIFSSSGDTLLFAREIADSKAVVALATTADCRASAAASGVTWWHRSTANDFLALAESHWVGLEWNGTLGAISAVDGAAKWRPIVAGVAEHVGVREWSEGQSAQRELLYAVDSGWSTDGLYLATETLPRN